MPAELVMPKWGLTMQEGLISRWLKQEGDEVAQGEPVLEVETEKMTNLVEAPAAGVLARILYPAGTTVAVTRPIGLIAQPGEALPEVSASPSAGEPKAAGAASDTTSIAAAAASTASRTAPSSGSRVFVSQAYADQAHQSAPSRSRPRSRPPPVALCERKVVTCVKAKTRTRSITSESGVTTNFNPTKCSTSSTRISINWRSGCAG